MLEGHCRAVWCVFSYCLHPPLHPPPKKTQDMTDLHEASNDLAAFIRRNGIGPILRGAALSTAMGVDGHYPSSLSRFSPLFKLPVDAIQRGRDHGELCFLLRSFFGGGASFLLVYLFCKVRSIDIGHPRKICMRRRTGTGLRVSLCMNKIF